jgi:hypothetical protein
VSAPSCDGRMNSHPTRRPSNRNRHSRPRRGRRLFAPLTGIPQRVISIISPSPARSLRLHRRPIPMTRDLGSLRTVTSITPERRGMRPLGSQTRRSHGPETPTAHPVHRFPRRGVIAPKPPHRARPRPGTHRSSGIV